MEVHHHSHTTRKKWTHYFWEFLMLFLAVFCGFLAEYYLEHTIEHNREKQFMHSMVEDLENDTIELKRAIGKCDTVAMYSDSVLIFLASNTPSDKILAAFASKVGFAGQRQTLINTDRTSSQLKNSGAMRLISKKNVSDKILQYWKRIEESNISLDRYMIYRDASRQLVFKLWVLPEVYMKGFLMPADSVKDLRVIDQDKKKWDELTNLTAMGGEISRATHSRNLKTQFDTAVELIALIKKEYHF